MGITHIYDSRDFSCYKSLNEALGDYKIDCVLNSLADERHITESINLLKEDGKFIELGKKLLYNSEKINNFHKNIQYKIIDLLKICHQNPKLVKEIFNDLMQNFARKKLQSLPYFGFQYKQIQSAFRFMQKSQHFGKIIVTPNRSTELKMDPNGAYVVTGGLGYLGLKVTEWLIDKGALHIFLGLPVLIKQVMIYLV